MKKSISAALGLSLVVAAAAQLDRPVSIYQSDPDHTFAFFQYSHLGFSQQMNRFDDVKGTVKLDRGYQTGQIDVTIDVASVSTGSRMFNEVLMGEQFFDVGKHPTITYRSTRLKFGRLDNVTAVDGDVTIKGITRPLSLEVTHFKCMMHPTKNSPACGVNAIGTIRRSDFDLGRYVPFVDDEIKLYVVLEGIEQ